MNRVVSSNFVVRHSLILAGVLVFIEALPQNISERLKVLVVLVGVLESLVAAALECLVLVHGVVDLINQVLH